MSVTFPQIVDSHYTNITVRGQRRRTRIREGAVSPEYTFDPESMQSHREFFTPWSSDPNALYDINTDVLGYSYVGNYKARQNCLLRSIPMEHPNFTNIMYAHSIKASPSEPSKGKDDVGTGRFDEARLDVTYTAPFYGVLTDDELAGLAGGFPDESSLLRFCTAEVQTAGKFQTIPSYGPLVFTTAGPGPIAPAGVAGTTVANVRAFLLFEADLQITWHAVPIAAYPTTAITACVGKTNNAAFGNVRSMLGESIAAGLLVCGLPKRKLRLLPNGSLGADLTYQFKYYPNGANTFFWARRGIGSGFATGGYDPAGNEPFYTAADFNGLFRPEGFA